MMLTETFRSSEIHCYCYAAQQSSCKGLGDLLASTHHEMFLAVPNDELRWVLLFQIAEELTYQDAVNLSI